ncbi:MAG: hypothetical protein ABIJ21_02170 [Nanoarchaeota archaeon]
MKIYCDTNVYIDLFEARKDRFRDLGEFALSVFVKVRNAEHVLVVSDWLETELEKFGHKGNFRELIADLNPEWVVAGQKDRNAARKLSSNFPDALHVMLAVKAGASCLVTRDVQDFAEFQDLILIAFPESL